MIEYVEGEGLSGPIIWEVDFNSPTGWREPRDMGWIPKLQAHVDQAKVERTAATQSDFDAWEREMS